MRLSIHDTIVVGGGISGLACALLSARRGRSVVLIEKSAHLSPTLRGFVRRGTYLDSGFHYAGDLGREGMLRSLLQDLGVWTAVQGQMRAWDTFDRVRFVEPDFEFLFPQGWDALEQGLCEAFPEECEGLRQFLSDVKALWQQGRAAFLQDRGRSLGALFAGSGGTLQEAINRTVRSPVLAGLLCSHGILHGVIAKETSLVFHSQVVGSYYDSATVIRGGGRFWVETFEKALRKAGVELRCGQGVVRIHVDDPGRFCGVELDCGEILTAERCISTVHPKLLLDMVPSGAFSPAYRRRIRELEETPSAVVLFGLCPRATVAGNLILAGQPRAIDEWKGLPVEDRPLFVSAPTGTVEGGVSVICPATLSDVPGCGHGKGVRPVGYEGWKRAVADRIVRRLSSQAGDLLGQFEVLDVATPLTFRDRLSSPEGGLYGVKHRSVDLPLLPRTAVEGLYLSGQALVAPGVQGAVCGSFLTDSCMV